MIGLTRVLTIETGHYILDSCVIHLLQEQIMPWILSWGSWCPFRKGILIAQLLEMWWKKAFSHQLFWGIASAEEHDLTQVRLLQGQHPVPDQLGTSGPVPSSHLRTILRGHPSFRTFRRVTEALFMNPSKIQLLPLPIPAFFPSPLPEPSLINVLHFSLDSKFAFQKTNLSHMQMAKSQTVQKKNARENKHTSSYGCF